MRIIRYLASLCILFIPSIVFARWDIVATDVTSGNCPGSLSYGPSLARNLDDYFCVRSCTISDTAQISGLKDKLADVIAERFPRYKGAKWPLAYMYSVDILENVFFMALPDPTFPGAMADVAYDSERDEYYVLNNAAIDQLNGLLGTQKIKIESDGEILRFCWLFTYLKNSPYRIKPISSEIELLIQAVINLPWMYNLGNIPGYVDHQITYPRIERASNLTNIRFFIARSTDIIRVDIVLEGSAVIKYDETKIATTLPWY